MTLGNYLNSNSFHKIVFNKIHYVTCIVKYMSHDYNFNHKHITLKLRLINAINNKQNIQITSNQIRVRIWHIVCVKFGSFPGDKIHMD